MISFQLEKWRGSKLINLEQLIDCRLCGATCQPLKPSGDLETCKIIVVSDAPNKQDLRFGELFENQGAYFCKKVLFKYFKKEDLYFTCIQKCINGNSEICSRKWLDFETKGKYIILMGKTAYSEFFDSKDFSENVGSYSKEFGIWYSPSLFETRGKDFVEKFNKFCEGVANEIDGQKQENCGQRQEN
jgi:uracil-DNA glycosylase